MLTRDEYEQFWIDLPDEMDALTETLVKHVKALQDRINQDSGEWTTRCCCAYDYPTAVCMMHRVVE